MSGLIIAADLSSIASAARSLGSSIGGGPPSGATASLGHAGADAALADFHSSMQQHEAAIAAHANQGAASMTGYLHAFEAAGD